MSLHFTQVNRIKIRGTTFPINPLQEAGEVMVLNTPQQPDPHEWMKPELSRSSTGCQSHKIFAPNLQNLLFFSFFKQSYVWDCIPIWFHPSKFKFFSCFTSLIANKWFTNKEKNLVDWPWISLFPYQTDRIQYRILQSKNRNIITSFIDHQERAGAGKN